jgi:hypothetical protein
VATVTKTFTITGFVKDATGAGVIGAVVTLASGGAAATTGTGGWYQLTLIPEGDYVVLASPPSGCQITNSGQTAKLHGEDGSKVSVDFSAVGDESRNRTISGRVLRDYADHEPATPLENAVVTATASNGAKAVATTNSQGAYMLQGLAAGAYTVQATLPGYGEFQPIIVTLDGSGAPASTERSFASHKTSLVIGGHVSASGALVVLEGGDTSDDAQGYKALVTTEDTGEYHFAKLSPGQYTITVFKDGASPHIQDVTIDFRDRLDVDFK